MAWFRWQQPLFWTRGSLFQQTTRVIKARLNWLMIDSRFWSPRFFLLFLLCQSQIICVVFEHLRSRSKGALSAITPSHLNTDMSWGVGGGDVSWIILNTLLYLDFLYIKSRCLVIRLVDNIIETLDYIVTCYFSINNRQLVRMTWIIL